ncbi:hypothetical protein ACRALDRAFT_212697 [Sodiomyces alcalophilus JCM 7366]|uniref:uncharacterized protein n=1 Tax=Sodiomyces alcalophilus JCM 7366 TaxID=591952 RepID=UPI0039B642E4
MWWNDDDSYFLQWPSGLSKAIPNSQSTRFKHVFKLVNRQHQRRPASRVVHAPHRTSRPALVRIIHQQAGLHTGMDLVGQVITLGDSSAQRQELVVGVWETAPIHRPAVYENAKLIRIERTNDLLKVAVLALNYMTSWEFLKHRGSILIGSASGGLGTGAAQLVAAFDMNIKMIGTCSPSKLD